MISKWKSNGSLVSACNTASWWLAVKLEVFTSDS